MLIIFVFLPVRLLLQIVVLQLEEGGVAQLAVVAHLGQD
jgi:hypothetical protein